MLMPLLSVQWGHFHFISLVDCLIFRVTLRKARVAHTISAMTLIEGV